MRGVNLLISRSLPEFWIDRLTRERGAWSRLVYLVDDDIVAGAQSAHLPRRYTERLERVASKQQPDLLDLADTVVVTSHALADRYAETHSDVRLLEPVLTTPLPGVHHFKAKMWRLGFHGTRAHREDLELISPALAYLHDGCADVMFELMVGRQTPEALQQCERVYCPRPRPWRHFKRLLGTPHLHIGLAPLLDNAFNRGKSWIKFLDIAAMGGVGVYSNRPPYTEVVEHGFDGLLADDTPESWYQCLQHLLYHPEDARVMAMRAQEKAHQLGDPSRAAQFWRTLS